MIGERLVTDTMAPSQMSLLPASCLRAHADLQQYQEGITQSKLIVQNRGTHCQDGQPATPLTPGYSVDFLEWGSRAGGDGLIRDKEGGSVF